VVTRENRERMCSIDVAKIKLRALRRTTLKRQGSSINLKKIAEQAHQAVKEMKNKVEEEDDDFISSGSSSSNTVIDGEIIKKPKISGFTMKLNSNRDENEYHLSKKEKEILQKETEDHIKSIIKNAKIQARNENNYFLTKYGAPEQLIHRNSRTALQSSRISNTRFADLSKNKTSNVKRKVGTLNIDKVKKIPNRCQMAPSRKGFQTINNFYPAERNVSPSLAIITHRNEMNYLTDKDWNKIPRSGSKNFRAQTCSTHFTQKPKNMGYRAKYYQSSLPVTPSQTTQIDTTPYRLYKIHQKAKR
jgi:hypothetical protein